MKNAEKWTPSKYVFKKGRLAGSRDSNEVGISSRLITDIIAGLYELNIKEHCTGSLIDLGCGKVPLYLVYKDYITDSVCVDWGDTCHKSEYIDFQCDLTKGLPFEDRKFNTIILSDVLEHIPCPEELWKEMNRILAINGKILMNTPFYYWLHEEPYDFYRYTEFALRRFAEMTGFKVIVLKPIAGVPEILSDILAKRLIRSPFLGKKMSMLVQALARWFVNTKYGAKLSQKSAVKFPLGYFMVVQKIDDV